MIVLLLLSALPALGQSATVTSSAYRPGRYVPLRLEATSAGIVRVRGGVGLQGVDWHAAGRSTVVVPLMIAGGADDPVALSVNDVPAHVGLRALGPADPDPPELTEFWRSIGDAGPAVGVDDDVYQQAALWQPGRGAAVRRWTLIATAVAVLALGVAAHVDPKRPTRWVVLVSAVGVAAAVALFPVDAPRRTLPADGRPGAEWVWLAASRAQTATEPWSPGLAFVPRTAEQAKRASPVLRCDAQGRPVAMDVRLAAGGRAVFIRPRTPAP